MLTPWISKPVKPVPAEVTVMRVRESGESGEEAIVKATSRRWAISFLRTAAKSRRQEPIPFRAVAIIALSVGLFATAQSCMEHRAVEATRARLIASRIGLSHEIAPLFDRLGAQLEAWTKEAAKDPYLGDIYARQGIDMSHASHASHASAPKIDGRYRERPTIYLRIPQADAMSSRSMRRAAALAPLDGLSSCLLRARDGGPYPFGEVAARAEMLGAPFLDDLRRTGNELRLRNLDYALSAYRASDFRLAREALTTAEYAVIALDEASPCAPSDACPADSGAACASTRTVDPSPRRSCQDGEALGAIRVSVRRLADGMEMLRVRRTPRASVFQAHGALPELAEARVRASQARGCAMAEEVIAFGDASFPLENIDSGS
ncbi:MAG: hypothetical protein NVS3B20_11960 [Polyangiales bacterium]